MAKMIPLDGAAKAAPTSGDRPIVNGKDLEIAIRMGIKMLLDGKGLDVIHKAITESKDPAMVIGQFLSQIMMALAQKLHEQVGLDPRIFLAKHGWLEEMLDYIEAKLKLPPQFSDEVYGQVLEVLKAAAQGGAGKNGRPPVPQQGQPQQQAPAAPMPPPGGPAMGMA
jgi:hypothetical protein